MERTDIINTLGKEYGERVTSIYAETYFNDDYSDDEKPKAPEPKPKAPKREPQDEFDEEGNVKYEWVSPSDLLIGILDLKPPFTSKITRGHAHEGILDIGDDVLDRERARFLKYMTSVIQDNDAAWNHILEHEKAAVAKKVKAIYHDILTTKSKTLMEEINIFYENSLQELENHLRTEVQTVLISAHTNIISDLNTEIREKLKKERQTLENVLQKRYESEVAKIKHYYKLLLDNEMYRNNKLVNQAIHERNDALKAFYSQIDAQNITSTMYMMCTERKKCRIRKFILENIQSTEIAEKHKKIKEREDVIEAFRTKEKQISQINKDWEEKIKKVLQLFLKFVSFSLKLLPEQTTFLLDLEKMVVLQLNEIQKTPTKTSSILVDTEEYNVLKFQEPKPEEMVCDKEPFIVEGDLSGNTGPKYGSRETLASDVDLPYIRLQRKFIYAKCGKMDEVKAFLESQRCKCRDPQPKPESPTIISAESTVNVEPESPTLEKSESSFEPLLIDEVQIVKDCPARLCQDWANKCSFPYINSYLDFTEENYERVKTILGQPLPKESAPDLIDPKELAMKELPFSATKEQYHHVETQYSSQEDFISDFKCPCMDDISDKSSPSIYSSPSKELNEILLKRKNSLQRIVNENPNLLKMFTDESFDFVYNIT